jgi:MFS family permease
MKKESAAWYRAISPAQRKALLSASLGWMLDSCDVMLYAMVLAHLMKDLGLDKATGGLMGSLTLLASAAGGIIFGLIADRVGRVRALMMTILIYSFFTAACGLARNIWQLAIFRVLLGLGMGGEWATGAALVAETWPDEHRGKALGIMQSSWAVGYALAAGITALVLPRFGWRAVFFFGVLPALVTLWIRKNVDEPEIWKRSRWNARRGGDEGEKREITSMESDRRNKKDKFLKYEKEAKGKNNGEDIKAKKAGQGHLAEIFRRPFLRLTLITTLMNAATMFAWWGLFTWIPAYLGLPRSEGGMGLDVVRTSAWIVVMQVGMWFGYISFGFICDRLGRKKTYIFFLLAAALFVAIYSSVRSNLSLLLLGPFVAFFGTGYFSGFGTITAEIFPTRIRASAQGFTYNFGRGLSALAPFTIGALARVHGLAFAFYLTAAFFLLAAGLALALPETKGRKLE